MAKKEPIDERNLDGSAAPTIPWVRARGLRRMRVSQPCVPMAGRTSCQRGRSGWMAPSTLWQVPLLAKARISRTMRTASSLLPVKGLTWSSKAKPQRCATKRSSSRSPMRMRRRSASIRRLRSRSPDRLRPRDGRPLQRNPLARDVSGEIVSLSPHVRFEAWTCAPHGKIVQVKQKGRET